MSGSVWQLTDPRIQQFACSLCSAGPGLPCLKTLASGRQKEKHDFHVARRDRAQRLTEDTVVMVCTAGKPLAPEMAAALSEVGKAVVLMHERGGL